MFPKTLKRAISPAEALPREGAHAFGRFCPRDGVGHINNALPMSVQREREIGVLGQRLQTEPARFINRIFADGADRTRHYGDAFPAIVSAAIQIETTGVFQRLATRDK